MGTEENRELIEKWYIALEKKEILKRFTICITMMLFTIEKSRMKMAKMPVVNDR